MGTGQTTQGPRPAVRCCLKSSRGSSELGFGRLWRTHDAAAVEGRRANFFYLRAS
ncbi:unnamed protein product [Ectocarpus sp. CCAP 1310/34]|nr:unnamed protein product [Ectocarpus sp. CCAP 1310/34]